LNDNLILDNSHAAMAQIETIIARHTRFEVLRGIGQIDNARQAVFTGNNGT